MLISTILSSYDLWKISPPEIFPDFRSCCNPFSSRTFLIGTEWRPLHINRPSGERGEIHLRSLDLLPDWRIYRMVVDLCKRPNTWRLLSREWLHAMRYHRFLHNPYRGDHWSTAPGKHVCWHGHKKFLSALFEADPTAWIKLPVAVWTARSLERDRFRSGRHKRRPAFNRYLYRSVRVFFGPEYSSRDWREQWAKCEQADHDYGYRCYCQERGEVE